MSALSDGIAAANAIIAGGMKLVADAEAFDVKSLLADGEAEAQTVATKVAPIIAAIKEGAKALNGPLDALGVALRGAGLASSGPNVESSLEINPGSNDRG